MCDIEKIELMCYYIKNILTKCVYTRNGGRIMTIDKKLEGTKLGRPAGSSKKRNFSLNPLVK